MIEDIAKLKKEILEIKLLLDLSSHCKNDEDKKMLLEELDRLTYKYYKAAVLKMRNMEGFGDGI